MLPTMIGLSKTHLSVQAFCARTANVVWARSRPHAEWAIRSLEEAGEQVAHCAAAGKIWSGVNFRDIGV